MSSRSEIPDQIIPERVIIGKITGAVGLRGAVKVHPLTDFPERFSQLDLVILERDGEIIEAHLDQVHYRGKKIVLEFAGYTDRTAAERLRGFCITVPGVELGALPDDEFYSFEMIGMRVYTPGGELIGTVVETYSVLAEDLLEVELSDGSEKFLLPFVKKFVKQVDIRERKLVVALIDGLA